MVDWIALFVSHGALAIVFWRLMGRADLDDESAPAKRHRPPGFGPVATADTPSDLPVNRFGSATPKGPGDA